MAKSRKHPDKEARIENEIVVDAYGPQERAMKTGIATWKAI
jgi:hypothetical protein